MLLTGSTLGTPGGMMGGLFNNAFGGPLPLLFR